MAESIHDNSTIVVKIILDDIDDNLRVVKLETLPPPRVEMPGERHERLSIPCLFECDLV